MDNVIKLKEQAISDKQLVESMKMQIKELERTHSLECAKSLEKVKELQSSIGKLTKENNALEANYIVIQREQDKDEGLGARKKDVSSLEVSL